MKTVFLTTLLLGAIMTLDVDFERDFEDGTEDEVRIWHKADGAESHSDVDTDFKLKQMGIPVVFLGSSGRCSEVYWARIGHHDSDSADSINEESVTLNYNLCAGVRLEVKSEEDDEKKLSDYLEVEGHDTVANPDSMGDQKHYGDARVDESNVLVVKVKAPARERKLGTENRILKLSINPEGKAVLEMGRGLVIV